MAETPDPLADWIATADAGNEAYIKRLALTDATVATMPSGDLRKALKALEAVHTIAAGWLADAPEVPVIDRDLAASVIQQILTRELLSKEGSDERD